MIADRKFVDRMTEHCAGAVSPDVVAFANQVKAAEKVEFLATTRAFCAQMPECDVGDSPPVSNDILADAFWGPLEGKTLVVL